MPLSDFQFPTPRSPRDFPGMVDLKRPSPTGPMPSQRFPKAPVQSTPITGGQSDVTRRPRRLPREVPQLGPQMAPPPPQEESPLPGAQLMPGLPGPGGQLPPWASRVPLFGAAMQGGGFIPSQRNLSVSGMLGGGPSVGFRPQEPLLANPRPSGGFMDLLRRAWQDMLMRRQAGNQDQF